MEFMQSFWHQAYLRDLIIDLKRLLDNLGKHQDLEVQARNLKSYEKEFQSDIADCAEVVHAIKQIRGQIEGNKQHLRDKFARRFTEFSAPENKTRFRKLFKPTNKRKHKQQTD